MRLLEFSRCGLSMIVAAAFLSACGGSSMPIRTADSATGDVGASKGSVTFNYTGKKQTFVVPSGVRRLTVVAHGGEGAGFSTSPSTSAPGRPGRVYAIIPVHPGEKLYIFVGGSGAHGGFNGGGAGGAPGYGSYQGNPGGGASDIRSHGDTLNDRIIVAAGGGGSGEAISYYATAYGGNGGGLVGKSGGGGGSQNGGGGGSGGTQSAGGVGGAGGQGHQYRSYGSYYGQGEPGDNGAFGLGGNGGNGAPHYSNTPGAGGGGGGYYGGGGGGGGGANYYSSFRTSQSGGGGGGSSYVEPSAITSRMWAGWAKAKSDDGLVVLSWK